MSTKNSDNDKKATTAAVTSAEIEKKIADAVGKDNYLCDTEAKKDYLQNTVVLVLSKIEIYVAKQNSISSVNLDTIVLRFKGKAIMDALQHFGMI